MRVEGLGFRVRVFLQKSGIASGTRVILGFRVQGLGFRVSGLGLDPRGTLKP